MNLTQEDFEKLVEEAKPAILNAFKEEVTKSISWEMKSKATELIRAAIEDWVKAEILPTLAEHLIASKDGLLSVAKKAADEVSDEIVKGLVASVKEKMANSWNRKAVFEALFK